MKITSVDLTNFANWNTIQVAFSISHNKEYCYAIFS